MGTVTLGIEFVSVGRLEVTVAVDSLSDAVLALACDVCCGTTDVGNEATTSVVAMGL